MPHFISLEPWTPGILESLIWINSLKDDPNKIIARFIERNIVASDHFFLVLYINIELQDISINYRGIYDRHNSLSKNSYT